ncbi:class F sortase [Streptomyces armeniacus]|uniref:Class F sortase n=1 Tax=Streptomyces armeniacus TaxID=83291 RepID=A0A345XK42_9ACTN|nr:class F sortase [Streptomyces armeniacus]AXK32008.1 class F sortase [Streptomyces armeniacus]
MHRTGEDGRGLRARRPGGDRLALGCAAFALVLGLSLVRAVTGQDGGSGPPQPDAAAGRARTAYDPRAEGATTPLPRSRPANVRIPSIGVDAPLTRVGLERGGWVGAPPPDEPNLAGWYGGSAVPGARGTSVLVGHVDNRSGPAVFYDLGALRPGHTVRVRRADGRTAVFTVYAVEVHDKDRFPGDRVYRDTGRAELRVLTCGGGYRAGSGYQGNVVVFARLTGTE